MRTVPITGRREPSHHTARTVVKRVTVALLLVATGIVVYLAG